MTRIILTIYIRLFGTPGQRQQLQMIRKNHAHRTRTGGQFDIDGDLDPDYWDPDEHNRRVWDAYLMRDVLTAAFRAGYDNGKEITDKSLDMNG